MKQNTAFDQTSSWITGGNRGIGAAISEELNELGLKTLRLDSQAFDLSASDQRRAWLNNQKITPGVLILNAAINFPKTLEEQSDEDFHKILQVNLISSREILLKVLPVMKSNSFGRIVFVSSLYASRARLGRSAYSISKAGQDALMRSVALEYASHGILANSVAPGFIETDLTYKNNSELEIQNIIQQIPVKRLGKPSEIAKLVAFLVSDANTYITGQTFHVDGGMDLV